MSIFSYLFTLGYQENGSDYKGKSTSKQELLWIKEWVATFHFTNELKKCLLEIFNRKVEEEIRGNSYRDELYVEKG